MATNPDSTDLAQLNRGRIEDPAKRESVVHKTMIDHNCRALARHAVPLGE